MHMLVSNLPHCDPDFLRNLLANLDVDPNTKDVDGNTPIMLLLQNYYKSHIPNHNHNHKNVTECLRVMLESDRVDIVYVKDRQGLGLEDLTR